MVRMEQITSLLSWVLPSTDVFSCRFHLSIYPQFNLPAPFLQKTLTWDSKARFQRAQKEIKIAGRNINDLRYADDTTLMAESEEELKSLSMKVKEESESVGLKLNIQKTKIMASGPITLWEIDGETVEAVSGMQTKSGSDFYFIFILFLFYFSGLRNHCRWWLQSWN